MISVWYGHFPFFLHRQELGATIQLLSSRATKLSRQMAELIKLQNDVLYHVTVALLPTPKLQMMVTNTGIKSERNHDVRHEDIRALTHPALNRIWQKVFEIDCHARLSTFFKEYLQPLLWLQFHSCDFIKGQITPCMG